MEFSEQVLILQTGKFREADIWVRVLSPTRGVFTAFAFGGSKSRQRFIGCLDIFNRVLFRVSNAGRAGYLTLQEGVLMAGVSRLRTDWTRLGLANNCAKFLLAFGVEADGAGAAFSLFSGFLEHLERADQVSPVLPLFFRLGLAASQGYLPDFSACRNCGSPLAPEAFFLVREGVLLCPSCMRAQPGQAVRLSAESLRVLGLVSGNEGYEWLGNEPGSLSGQVRQECSRAIDGFIEYHVGLLWRNGRFSHV